MSALRTKSTILMSAGLTLALLGAFTPDTRADVRIHGEIRTPHLRVQVGNTGGLSAAHPHPYRYEHRAWHDHRWAHRLGPRDYRIAWRLSYLTGIGERRILWARASGLSYREIARRLGISRSELRAARSRRAFLIYLDRAVVDDRDDSRERWTDGSRHRHRKKARDDQREHRHHRRHR